MKRAVAALVVLFAAVLPRGASTAGPSSPTIEQFLTPGTPTEVVAAKKAERIAWTAYEHGLRNVYTAAGPAFAPVRLTNVTKDDGIELSDISISDDGAMVVFVRGTQPNRDGWVANPTAIPAGADAHDLGGAHDGRRRVEARRRDDAGAVAGWTDGRVREGRTDLRYAVGADEAGTAQERAAKRQAEAGSRIRRRW